MHLSERVKDAVVRKARRSSLFFRLIVLIVLGISLITSTVAWVSMNFNTDSKNMNVAVDYDRFFVESCYYKYNVNDSKVDYTENMTGITFNQYDLVFRSRNRYTPIIAAIKMHGEDIDPSGTITVEIMRDESIDPTYLDDQNKEHLSVYFTSIMRVTAMVGASYYSSDPDTLFNNIDTNTVYNTTRARTGDTALSKVFTTATENDGVLSNVSKHNIVFEVDYTSSDFVTIDGRSTLIIYLYITYDEGYTGTDYNGLLGIYQKTTEALSISSTGDITDTSVQFENDLSGIKVSHS